MSKTEEKCREIVERITGHKFPTGRYDFLVNPETNRQLELDMFCPELMLACEYNGEQHYQYIEGKGPFHKTKEEFLATVRRDSYKKQVCQMLGIYLIIIPYTVNHKLHLEPYIKRKLEEFFNL